MQSGKHRQRQSTKPCRTGFSLVELIIALLVIAAMSLAVFASGAVVVAKARTSRMDSDFHNFETAISAFMFEDRSLATMDSGCSWADFRGAALRLNKYLPDGYEALVDESVPSEGPIMSSNENQVIFRTAKEDPYGNSYYLLFDTTNRNSGKTEYYITVLSAGGNGKADICGPLDKDDAFLLGQYSNGDVYVKSYFMDEDGTDGAENPLTKGESSLSSLSGLNTPKNYGTGLSATGDPHVHRYIITENTPATCTSAGLLIQTCTGCGNTKRSTPAALGHDFGEYVVTKQATCTAQGVRTSTCSRCSQTKTLSIEAKGHSFGGWSVTKTGTCTESGQEQRECTACHITETRDTGTTDDHSWGAPVITDATCVTDGSRVYTCTRCGATKTETIPATGTHVFSDTPDSVVPATCTTNGKKVYTCQTCPQTKEEVITATGSHTYSTTPTRVVAAACTENGRNIYACTVCGAEREEVIPPTGHNFPAAWTKDVAATCTTDGLQIKRCQNDGCSETLKEVLPKLGHSYPSEWTIVTDSTCTDDGLQEKRCQHDGCTETLTSVISKTGHSYSEWTRAVEPTCYTDGEWRRVCANCGDIETLPISMTGIHVYGEYEVTTPATCTAEGVQTATCTTPGCGHQITAPIPVLGHTAGEWEVVIQATRNNVGSKQRACVICGEVLETAEIPLVLMNNLYVTNPPAKTDYVVGEDFIADGMVITAAFDDGSTDTIPTGDYTITDGTSMQTTTSDVTISYTENGKTLSCTQAVSVTWPVSSLHVTTNPDKMEYIIGEDFDPAGMVVTAEYADRTMKVVTDKVLIQEGTDLAEGQAAVTITYAERGVTVSVALPIAVRNSLTALTITTPPDKTTYELGDNLDTTGMVVTASYANGTSKVVQPTVVEEYAVLEYIESTGTQYIDLNIVPTNHTFEIQYDSGSYNNDEKLFGTEAGYQYFAFALYSNKYYWGLNGSQTSGGTWSSGKKTLLYNSGSNYGVIQDGVTLGSGSAIAANGQSLCLFKRVTSEGVFFQGLTYYCKLTEKSTNNVVRDCIPVRRLSDNAVGLYDKVEDKFYGNNGTGTFVAGAETGDYIFSDGTIGETAQNGYVLDTVFIDSEEITSITVSYADMGDTKTVSMPITVNPLTQLVNYTMLYDYGDECTSITGGWTTHDFSYVEPAGNGSKATGYQTVNSLNLSQYANVVSYIVNNTNPTGTTMCFMAGTTYGVANSGLIDTKTSSTKYKFSSNDLSQWTNQKITFSAWGGGAYTSRISLSRAKNTNNLYVYANYQGYGNTSAYMYCCYAVKADNWQGLCNLAGLGKRGDIAEVLADSEAVSAILENENAVNYMIKRCTGNFAAFATNNSTFMSALNSSPYASSVYSNQYWNKILSMSDYADSSMLS